MIKETSLSIPWITLQQLKGANYVCLQWLEWISRELCVMKKKTNILFHIPYDPIYIIVLKWQNFRNGLVAANGRDRGWCDYKH